MYRVPKLLLGWSCSNRGFADFLHGEVWKIALVLADADHFTASNMAQDVQLFLAKPVRASQVIIICTAWEI